MKFSMLYEAKAAAVGGGNINIGQSAKGVASPGTTVTTSTITTAVSGSTFVVVTVTVGATISAANVSDSKSNTYTELGTSSSNGCVLQMFYKENGTGGSGHTATVTLISDHIVAFLVEITGGLTSGILDNTSINESTDNATPFEVTSGTTEQANELILAAWGGNATSDGAVGVSGPFTMVIDEETGSANQIGGVAYRIVSATGAFTASFTNTPSSQTALKINGFKSA